VIELIKKAKAVLSQGAADYLIYRISIPPKKMGRSPWRRSALVCYPKAEIFG